MVLLLKRHLTNFLKIYMRKQINGEHIIRTDLPENSQLYDRSTLLCVNSKSFADSYDNILNIKNDIENKIRVECPYVENVFTEESSNNDDHKFIFQVKCEHIFKEIVNDLKRNIDNYGKELLQFSSPQNIIVEFSSPNIAKPFHVGNFRSTIIGNFIANVNSYFGHNVIRLNYLGDYGTQFGILSLGYDYFGDDNKLKDNALRHLLEVYVKANAECERNEQWRDNAKERFNLIETRQNVDAIKQWQHFRALSIEELKNIYSRLGIAFDEIHGESMYSHASFEVIEDMRKLNMIEDGSDGAVYAVLKNHDNRIGRNKIPLIKKDGSSLYISRDIAAAIHRKDRFNFDKMYYIVDNSQFEHFVNLKNILGETGNEWQNDMIHVKFGRIHGMSTRKGDVVFLDDLLDEAKERALKTMMAKETTKVSGDEMESVADTLGISGIIINDLKHRRTQNYKFDWDNALQQTGNTGIALQYAHSRMCSLELNCGISLDINCSINYDSINTPEGNQLISTLAMFDDVLYDSYTGLEPKFLVKYLFILRNAINKANKCLTVKGETEDIAKTRLLLFCCSKMILQKGMKLLGLNPLTSM